MADTPVSADPVLDPQNPASTPVVQEANPTPVEPAAAPEADPATTPAEAPVEPASEPETTAPVDGDGVQSAPVKRTRSRKAVAGNVIDPVTEDDNSAQYVRLPDDVPANVSLLDFRCDEFGFLSDMKYHCKMAAGRINGQVDKMDLFEDAMLTLLAHARARYAEQVKTNQTMLVQS